MTISHYFIGPIFKNVYAPAMNYILKRGVVLIAVSSFKDRVVSLASSIADGFQHPNIYRALYTHERYKDQKSFLKELSLLAIKRRNAGLYEDIARFVRTNYGFSDGLVAVS
jgi:hypothetical protein